MIALAEFSGMIEGTVPVALATGAAAGGTVPVDGCLLASGIIPGGVIPGGAGITGATGGRIPGGGTTAGIDATGATSGVLLLCLTSPLAGAEEALFTALLVALLAAFDALLELTPAVAAPATIAAMVTPLLDNFATDAFADPELELIGVFAGEAGVATLETALVTGKLAAGAAETVVVLLVELAGAAPLEPFSACTTSITGLSASVPRGEDRSKVGAIL